MPLLHDGELFGIVEILSSRPNAFGQRDVYNLQVLTDRILESRKQSVRTIAPAPQKKSGSLQRSGKFVLLNKLSESSSEIPRQERFSRRNGIWTPILGVLVIVAAILLGTLIGWRLGWRAAIEYRHRPLSHRTNIPSKLDSKPGSAQR